MTNDEKNVVVDDLNKQKSDKKSIAKIIFSIILLGLVLVWFTASFCRNINKLDDTKEVSSINYSKNVTCHLEDNSLDDLKFYSITTDTATTVTFQYYILNYRAIVERVGNNEFDTINARFIVHYSKVDSVISGASIGIGGYSPEAEDEFSFYYHFNPEELSFLISREVYSVSVQLAFLFNEFSQISSYYFVDSVDNTIFEDSIDYTEEYYFNTLNSDSLVLLYNTFLLSDFYNDLDLYLYYLNGYEYAYDIGYNEGYDEGREVGYDEGYLTGVEEIDQDAIYHEGFLAGQKDNINQNAFKTLFNAILNAPYNIFSGLLEFEILGVNLFSLFSFIFTTILILTIIKFFLK